MVGRAKGLRVPAAVRHEVLEASKRNGLGGLGVRRGEGGDKNLLD